MRPSRLAPLLMVWLATLSVDRLDLLGGAADFVFTPYLALTPVILLLVAIRAGYASEPARLPEGFRAYTLLLAALIGVSALSGVLGLDPTMSARRSVLFLAAAGGTLFVSLALVEDEQRGRILAGGAELGILLALVVSLLTAWALVWAGPPLLRLGPATLDLTASTYGGILPRVSGAVQDPNRAGLNVLFFIFLLARWGRPGPRRSFWMTVGTAMALLTLSRSLLLAAAALVVAYLLTRGALRIRTGHALAATVAVLAVGTVLLARPETAAPVVSSLEPLAGRFSLREQSTQDHFRLLALGMEEGTASVRRAALGVGYGNAHLVLKDVFPGNKYGNFHSLYVTLLVESGVFALLLFLVVLARPLVVVSPFLPMVAALAAFSLFYQVGNQPIQWMVLGMAWMLPGDA